ncbi:hypothetical protein BV898_16878 [Hypsibius exemplaris]|uniref:G-protein coupled receptors family 1 profile domain-containing protein n=1 Tax=Hypsibius exemplaris TaxID=2072580 RepID=A0A9X6NLB2_HYPEX|nr:hypothetical protein BV898_16878 [Hypsibius exemplaris]
MSHSVINTTAAIKFQNGTVGNRTSPAPCPGITPAEWMEIQLPTIALSFTMITAQVFNLIIFALWRNKEPYIFLHICLAVASLLAGLSVASSIPLRFVARTPVNIFVNQLLGIALLLYAHSASILANFAISLDRWLSVEFAIWYRTTISQRKALLVGIISTFVLPLVLAVPKFVVYWEDMTWTPCTGLKHFSPKGIGAEISEAMIGPIYLPLLFLSQMRILVIATRHQLRRYQHAQRPAGVGPVAVLPVCLVVGIVWSSFLGSMAIVFLGLISHVPRYLQSMLVQHSIIRVSVSSGRLTLYITFIQHCASPVIYLFFWHNYRNAVLRFVRQLRAVVAPHPGLAMHPIISNQPKRR